MLKTEIDTAKRKVNTDTVQMTIGEISTMYSSKELNIIPDFQRLFRWSDEKKSNFIESILIGIPIPPAFVYESDKGTWELVDGLQRISTVLEFMGVLEDPDTKEKRRSILTKTKYLPSLEGIVWSKHHDSEIELDKTFQLFFRRHRFDFQILKHPSDPKTKFDLFQRLNRGGAYANEQEVRTCSMVLADSNFTKAIKEFSDRPDMLSIFRVSEEQKQTQKNVEYAVRLIVHIYTDYDRSRDVQEFLDQAILDVMDKRKQATVLETITWTVETLHRLFGEEALIPTEDRLEGIATRFSLRALEGIAVGIARNRRAITALKKPDAFIKKQVTAFWKQPEVLEMSSPGLRGTVRLQRTVDFGATWFKP